MLVILLVAIVVQGLAANVTNVYTAGLSLLNSVRRSDGSAPRWLLRSLRSGSRAFPGFIEEAQTWISHLGNLGAPLAGVVLADYVILKHCATRPGGAVRPPGRYRYLNGVNVAAVVAIAVGMAVYYTVPDAWIKVVCGSRRRAPSPISVSRAVQRSAFGLGYPAATASPPRRAADRLSRWTNTFSTRRSCAPSSPASARRSPPRRHPRPPARRSGRASPRCSPTRGGCRTSWLPPSPGAAWAAGSASGSSSGPATTRSRSSRSSSPPARRHPFTTISRGVSSVSTGASRTRRSSSRKVTSFRLVERRALRPGDLYALFPPHDDIHRVSTTSAETSVSIHLLTNDTGCTWRHTLRPGTGCRSLSGSGYANVACETSLRATEGALTRRVSGCIQVSLSGRHSKHVSASRLIFERRSPRLLPRDSRRRKELVDE